MRTAAGALVSAFKGVGKSLLKQTPYRVVRSQALNRFDATAETLARMRLNGYRPRQVVDGGANVGGFARLARSIYPEARIHLVDPQPACAAALRSLAETEGYSFHPVALGNADGGELEFVVDPDGVTTGAHVAPAGGRAGGAATVRVPVASLDGLLGEVLSAGDRALLKLDLQGWEVEALRGAERVLSVTEACLIEVSFFSAEGFPLVAEIVRTLDDRGFDLYDVAALAERQRDHRARQADLVFVSRSSPLAGDRSWG